MALTSPGVEVSVINESFYVPSDAGTTPLLIIATAQDKLNGAGTGTAAGTTSANANSVYLISSQRELTETFGDPTFYTDASSNPINGYELNEYGLQAAYSFLGIANRAFVLRANVDLASLAGSATAPTAAPANGTYWFDIASTVPGLFEWSKADQAFTTIIPTYITSVTDLVGSVSTGAPKTSIGSIGDYAINTTHVTNKTYYKTAANAWIQVGSAAWYTLHGSATLHQQSAHTDRPLWKSSEQDAATGSIWFKTTTPNSGASVAVKLYSSSTASWNTVSAPLYATNHAAIYGLDPVNGGTSLSTGTLYTQYNVTEDSIKANLDDTDTSRALQDFQIFRFEGGATTITSNDTSPTFTSGHTFKIQETVKASGALSSAVTVTLAGTDADAFVAAVSAAGLTNVTAEVLSTGAIRMTHALGGEFRMWQVTGTALDDAGFGTANGHAYGTYTANSTTLVDNLYDAPAGYTEDSTTPAEVVASNWKRLSYTASTSEPANEPTDGTIWYNTNLEADILAHDGTKWDGYVNVYASTDPNGPQFSATKPTTQSDGTALVANDLWIDTSDLENYPKIYRYNTALTDGADFELIDNTDQTTENGIVFADARSCTAATKADSSSTGGAPADSSIVDLLSDDFVDPDAPNPALYPQSILLFNTRRSGYNVKEYRNAYITTATYPGSGSTGKGNVRYGNESVASYFPDRWVTKNANSDNGAGTFGRKAVRKVITAQLKSELNTNQAIREDQRGFNVIATPGYPEVIAEMINLNTDRNSTAFVVGDTPFRLESSSTALTNWANNSAGASDNGEDGLVSSSDYLGVFYPSGRTTDNSGNNVVVPASHMMLRVLANNDNIGFPWFAPAGTRRGIVDNATAVGYVEAATGEFQTISLTESTRDAMHTAKINPITFFSGAGIVNFGNLTKTSTSSALDRINVSRLTVYLRSQLDALAKPFIFEPNDTLTRNEIKQAVESFLLELVGQRALYDFLVVCDETNNTATRIDRNELYVDIAIEPVKSVEFIYIPLRIKNTGEIANLGN
jgi:phage tail sheath protein FI